MKPPILSLYNTLLDLYGEQGWWPLIDIDGSNPTKSGALKGYHPGDYSFPKDKKQQFQIIIGAILTQNTSWVQVERGLLSLHENGLLDPQKIVEKPDIAKSCIKVCGYYNQKFNYIKSACELIPKLRITDSLWAAPSRDELLCIKGIGPETADSILCYAFSQNQFVVDAYTRRVFQKLGWIETNISYLKLKKWVENSLPNELIVYQEFHALLVEFAKRLKKPTSIEKKLIEKLCGP
tara:strand:- start:2382 stop:3089 length:708 start_codon:yes stop_codon:yes gene_type:complete